jgi:hypothetical protein
MFGLRMAYPTHVKQKARELQTEKKLTIDELAERLAIPRTTTISNQVPTKVE